MGFEGQYLQLRCGSVGFGVQNLEGFEDSGPSAVSDRNLQSVGAKGVWEQLGTLNNPSFNMKS